MLDRQTLDQILTGLGRVVPALNAVNEEVRTSMRQVLQESFNRLNVLTRADFEAQVQALARAEARIEALETRLAAWEQADAPNAGAD